jgi:hypothetical protein
MVWTGAAGTRGSLESALPGEWAALFITLVVIAVVGAAVLVATFLRHERVLRRRYAVRARMNAVGAGLSAARGGGRR